MPGGRPIFSTRCMMMKTAFATTASVSAICSPTRIAPVLLRSIALRMGRSSMMASHSARGDSRRNGGRTPRRNESCQLAQYPQDQDAASDVQRRQTRQRVRRAQPLAEGECEDRARNDPASRQQPVLEHEVTDDVDAARADRATRTDLLATDAHEEARETDD